MFIERNRYKVDVTQAGGGEGGTRKFKQNFIKNERPKHLFVVLLCSITQFKKCTDVISL